MNKLNELLTDIDKAEAVDSGQNAARERFQAEAKAEQIRTESRIKKAELGYGDFTVYELTFSAGFRCICGAGMAYPDGIGMHGAWYCSAILMGKAEAGSEHTPAHPFAFYEIKSEAQPSARGATTRPEGTHIETVPRYVCKKCKHVGKSERYRDQSHESLKRIVCSNCGERYINDDGTSNLDGLSVRFFHEVVND